MSSSGRPKNVSSSTSTIANLTAALIAGTLAETSTMSFDTFKVSNQIGKQVTLEELSSDLVQKSLGSAVGRQIIKTGFAFGFYQPILTFYSGDSSASTFTRVAASVTSGTVGSLLAFPMDIMTVQAQAGSAETTLSRAAAAMPMYMSRQVVTFSTQLFAYDWLKNMALSSGSSDSIFTHALCGFLSGSLAAVVSNPLDVSTVNVQAMKQTPLEAVKSMAIPEYAARGLGYHALRLGTWNTVMFVAFEKLKYAFGTR